MAMKIITQEELEVLIPVVLTDGKTKEVAHAHIKLIDDLLDIQKMQAFMIPPKGKKTWQRKNFLDVIESRLEMSAVELKSIKEINQNP